MDGIPIGQEDRQNILITYVHDIGVLTYPLFSFNIICYVLDSKLFTPFFWFKMALNM